jgi:hypothetical protein
MLIVSDPRDYRTDIFLSLPFLRFNGCELSNRRTKGCFGIGTEFNVLKRDSPARK